MVKTGLVWQAENQDLKGVVQVLYYIKMRAHSGLISVY